MATYYQITNTMSGADLGTYEANSKAEALDKMAEAAGYEDYEQAQQVAPVAEGYLQIREVRFALLPIGDPMEHYTGIKALDLREQLETEPEGVEAYRVEIQIDGKDAAEAADLLWYPRDGRGGLAWGAGATWTDADSAEDAVLRCLTDQVIA